KEWGTLAESLWDRITSDLKSAMKAQEKEKTSVLRKILSELKYAKANLSAQEQLPERDALKVVSTYHKRLTKSLADYPDGEKRTAIQAEIAIVENYLPTKASEGDVAAAVDRLLASTDERNFGLLMKQAMTQLGDAADGKMVSRVLKAKLSGP